MKNLQQVKPTPEQLKLITIPTPGIRIIKGAAGSGKTTTSLLMLRTALGYLLDVSREKNDSPTINVKVFSFNRTLAAYVSQLAKDISLTIKAKPGELNVEVTTLGKYLNEKALSKNNIISEVVKSKKIKELAGCIPLLSDFLIDEVEYVLGLLLHNDLESYITIERTGRGILPRVDHFLRRRILDEVIYPYLKFKSENLLVDWDDLSVIGSETVFENIDIAIIDEAQDFSANQLRSIIKQLSPLSFTIIVLDSAQRIYKRGFTWKDVGINDSSSFRLERNYRNTIQIASFVKRFIENSSISFDNDATLSNIDKITRQGRIPQIVEGRFKYQMSHIVAYIKDNIDLNSQSIGFLHPKGGGWFDYIKTILNRESIDYIEISRTNNWPESSANVALSTIHSAKGLEFDFVFIMGLQHSHFIFNESDSEDINYSSTIRLISMGITRAKENVIIGYSSETKPSFISLFDKITFEAIKYGN
ncbi:3'-5' exonuclease [Shewanella sp. H8]|uniref:3'-5' exonuclease n=1 Tax=Shewanella sp. H8 TaxID=3342676 RepID=UPI00331487BB